MIRTRNLVPKLMANILRCWSAWAQSYEWRRDRSALSIVGGAPLLASIALISAPSAPSFNATYTSHAAGSSAYLLSLPRGPDPTFTALHSHSLE